MTTQPNKFIDFFYCIRPQTERALALCVLGLDVVAELGWIITRCTVIAIIIFDIKVFGVARVAERLTQYGDVSTYHMRVGLRCAPHAVPSPYRVYVCQFVRREMYGRCRPLHGPINY